MARFTDTMISFLKKAGKQINRTTRHKKGVRKPSCRKGKSAPEISEITLQDFGRRCDKFFIVIE